jgi:CheY-like chemotaxis protein
VTTAGSAQEGLEALQRERPAVLLSDIAMPEHDGFWLIAQVRALSPVHGGKTPAAALTSLKSAEDRARILRAGFQSHITKPIEPQALVAIVAVLAIKE